MGETGGSLQGKKIGMFVDSGLKNHERSSGGTVKSALSTLTMFTRANTDAGRGAGAAQKGARDKREALIFEKPEKQLMRRRNGRSLGYTVKHESLTHHLARPAVSTHSTTSADSPEFSMSSTKALHIR